MSILAFLVAVRTFPKPSVFAEFDGFYEELADDRAAREEAVLLSVLLVDDFVEFGLVPVVHVVSLLSVFTLARVREYIALLRFPDRDRGKGRERGGWRRKGERGRVGGGRVHGRRGDRLKSSQ